MPLLGVPWAIGAHDQGIPEVSADAARAVAHLASSGLEGVGGPGDLAVVPRAVPGGGVLVRKGTIVVRNRAPGVLAQSYVDANDGDVQVTINPTGSGGGRVDLIAYVVEDPQYAGQPYPTDPVNGPYGRFRVFEGVNANTDELADVVANQTGYALALVTLPASTGTVEAAHITNLRDLPNPRSDTAKRSLDVGDKGTFDEVNTAGFEKFPQAAQWNVKVPKWATRVQLELRVTGVRVTNNDTDAGDWRGRARLKLGTLVTSEKIINPDVPNANKGQKFSYSVETEVAIPQAMRGTTQSLEAQALRQSVSSGVEVREAAGTTVIAEARFIEAPSTDPVESFL